MADENKTERVQLLMTPSEVKAIDDWSFENRIRGRAEAMRRLCQMGIGLDAESKDLLKLAEEAVEGTKQTILTYLNSVKSRNPKDVEKFNIFLVDALGHAARLNGFIARLVGVSELLRDQITEDDLKTYREMLAEYAKKVQEERKSKQLEDG